MYKKKRFSIGIYMDNTLNNLLMKTNDTSMHVLCHIIRQSNLRDNRWYAVKENKNKIMNKLDIKLPTLDKHIRSLKERGFIRPMAERSVYSLNLEIFDIKFPNAR